MPEGPYRMPKDHNTRAFNLANKVADAAKRGPNMSLPPPHTGSGYVGPTTGLAHARLVGYFEMGKHEEKYRGQKRLRDRVVLVFELSGPKHPPRQLPDATFVPRRVTVQESMGLSFFTLFGQMNYAGKATHMAELLGEAYLIEVFHKTSRDGEKTYASLKGPNGYNIKRPVEQDPTSGRLVQVAVDPPVTELRAFLWTVADTGMWDSIHIAGQFEERKDDLGEVVAPAASKNVIQEKIMRAVNWKSHPLASAIGAGQES